MHWIVGIDFEGRSEGALHMAAWLREHAGAGTTPEFTGVHVLAESERRALTRDLVAALPGRTLDDLRTMLAGAGLGASVSSLHVEWAPEAEEGLAHAATNRGADGLLIGRAAASEGPALVRLGRVARRLLRSLPVPVLVVPPDLHATDIGGGPILLATNLDAASVQAGRVAQTLAESLGRPLRALTVDDLQEAITAVETTPIGVHLRPRTLDEVRAWTTAHALPEAQPHVAHGERVAAVVAEARACDAPLVVCGSRGLGLVDRIFASSMASALASAAHCPVLVVPSPRQG
jgi:nucleotide-binding universal stress UspA family protein